MTETMFKLKRPCAKCPFRSDIDGYLRRGRAAEIARSLAEGSIFACHETTVPGDDDDEESSMELGPGSQFCAGALLVLENGDAPNQPMREAERLGLYDPSRMDRRAPVVGSLAEFVHHHGDEEEEHECCHVSDAGCEAPAGYLINGVAVPADEGGDVHECPSCGEPVCDSCSNDAGLCVYCSDEDDD